MKHSNVPGESFDTFAEWHEATHPPNKIDHKRVFREAEHAKGDAQEVLLRHLSKTGHTFFVVNELARLRGLFQAW